MNKKNTTFWVLLVLLFSIIFGYSLVFAWWTGKIVFKLSNNIFTSNVKLNRNRLIIRSKENIEDVKIKWDCWVTGKFVNKNNNYYVFDIYVLNKKCDNKKIKVTFEKKDFTLTTVFNITKAYNLYSTLLDYSDKKFWKKVQFLEKSIKKLEKYRNYNENFRSDSFNFLKSNRRLLELEYMENFMSNIIEKRKNKYVVPVKWSPLPQKINKLPNAGRPYRDSYTDWIHHWWDFDANFWDNVVSLDDWIVIRVIDKFDNYDFSRIKYENNLSDMEKLKNLDILRGKQVWIKTMKWDVAFYSHLNNIFTGIEEWVVISKWQPLWTVWKTGVPDKNYSDYHLHIPIHKNPYIIEKDYSLEDYFKWDWYFKGKTSSYILENQINIFE